MGKLIKLVLFLVVIIIVAVAVLLIRINPILESQKPQIESFLSEKLRNEVKIGSIKLSLFPTTAVKINDVELKSKNSKNLKLGFFLLDTSLLKILSKQIKVNSLIVSDLNLELTKTAAGILINGMDLKKDLAGPAPSATDAAPAPEKVDTGSESKFDYDIIVSKVELKNANIVWIDESVSPAQSIPIGISQVVLNDIDLSDGKASINVILSLLGTKKDNLTFRADVAAPGLDVDKASIKKGEFSFTDLDAVKIKNVAKAYGADLNAVPLDETAYAKVSIREINLASQRLDAEMDVVLQSSPWYKVRVMLSGVASELNVVVDLVFKGTPFKMDAKLALVPGLLQPNRVDIQPSKLTLFNGNADFDGGYALSGNKSFTFVSKATGLDIARMYRFATEGKGEVSLSGTVDDLTTDFRGSGINPKETVSGGLNLTVKNGAVEGINALAKAFETTLKVPGFSEALIGHLPERYKGLLKDERTAFETFETVATIGGQRMNISRLLLKHRDYEVSGTGNVTFAGEIAMKAMLKLSKEASEEVVKKNNKLSLLLDSENFVSVPISVTKSVTGKAVVTPDTEELIRRVVQSTIAQKTASAVKEKTSEKVEQGAQKLTDKLGTSTSKALGRVFGN